MSIERRYIYPNDPVKNILCSANVTDDPSYIADFFGKNSLRRTGAYEFVGMLSDAASHLPLTNRKYDIERLVRNLPWAIALFADKNQPLPPLGYEEIHTIYPDDKLMKLVESVFKQTWDDLKTDNYIYATYAAAEIAIQAHVDTAAERAAGRSGDMYLKLAEKAITAMLPKGMEPTDGKPKEMSAEEAAERLQALPEGPSTKFRRMYLQRRSGNTDTSPPDLPTYGGG